MWPDRRIIDLFKTEFPIVLARWPASWDAELVIAAAQGGALGSLHADDPAEKAREQVNIIRQRVTAPVNMNSSATRRSMPIPRARRDGRPGLGPTTGVGPRPAAPVNAANRAPFDEANVRGGGRLRSGSGQLPFRPAGSGADQSSRRQGCIVIRHATVVKEAILL